MRIEKRNSLLSNFLGILLLCVSGVFADYIEGIDTTDVNGYGLDSAFQMVTNGYVTGQNIVIYHMDGYLSGYFNYSFNDIKIAAESINCITSSDQSGECTFCAQYFSNRYLINNYCFVIKKFKDSTYSKVQILNHLTNNRYVFKFGTNTSPNNPGLEDASYDRTVRYKPNNFSNIHSYYNCGSEFPGISFCSWELPLPNNNHLLGYIFYKPKIGVVIDTTKPVNLAQWDSVYFTVSPQGGWYGNGYLGIHDQPYLGLVADYEEGKSDFLDNWWTPRQTLFPDATKQGSSPINKIQPNLEIKKSSSGYSISFLFLPHNSNSVSLSIFNMTGIKVAEFTGIKSNQVFWKTSGRNLAQGQYIVQLELPDKRVFSSRLVYSR